MKIHPESHPFEFVDAPSELVARDTTTNRRRSSAEDI